METQIKYNEKRTLAAPAGDSITSIKARITIAPKDAGVLIYGYKDPDTLACLEVRGRVREIDLPFIRPEILLTYLGGLTSIGIEVIGWRDSRNEFHSSPGSADQI